MMDLQPCPFCGEAAKLEICDNDYGDLHVWCKACDAGGPPAKSGGDHRDEAINLWNQRNAVQK